MKKQRNPSIKAHFLWSALILLALLAVCAIPFALAQRSATRQSNQSHQAPGTGSPVIQQKIKSSAVGSDNEKFMVRMMPATLPGPVTFGGFDNPAPVPRSLLPSVNALINNNIGFTICTQNFTQSETTVVSFASTIVAGFNDSGSNATSGNQFTGWSRSTDGGATWTDGGLLPASAGGDAGDPVLARDNTTGRLYFATLGFSVGTIQVFRSTDNGATWLAPVNGTPGGASEDKEWITVDNFAGSGNGNVYLVSRSFGAPNGIYVYRSTDGGATFGPSGGTLIVSGSPTNVQGAFVTVSPDHSVHAYWYHNGGSLNVRKSTDQGVTFAAPVTIVSSLSTLVNGDLGLTGTPNGGSTSGFRSNTFPHAAVNPVSGNIYVAWFEGEPNFNPAGTISFSRSTDGGTTFSSPLALSTDPSGFTNFAGEWGAITVGQLGGISVTWEDKTPAGAWEIFFSRSNDFGATFTSPMSVSGPGASGSFSLAPVLVATSNSDVCLAWVHTDQWPGGPFSVYSSRSAALSSVTLGPTDVTGGSSSTGTVAMNGPAPTGGAVVSLSSSDPSVTLPATATIPEGTTSTSFNVTTSPVASATTAIISAVFNGVTQTASITVEPP